MSNGMSPYPSTAFTRRLRRLLVPAAVLLIVTGCAAPMPPAPADEARSVGPGPSTSSTAPAPSSTEAQTPTAASSTLPSPTSDPANPAAGSSAVFEHFKVTVDQLQRRSESEVLVHASVCVRSLPPDPQGNRTRISWNPWSARAGRSILDSALTGSSPEGMFPSDATYARGDCASGWIPFPASKDLDEITYANSVGDRAVWDGDRLAQPPTTSTTREPPSGGSQKRIGEGTFIVGDDISPGRYKARADQDGSCYWAQLMDDTGDSDSIIANNISEGASSVTIKSSDGAFETSGCTLWVRQ